MRPSHDRSPSEGYSRPQLPWQCGLSDEGPPCAAGPSGWGRCPAAAACHPKRDGDRWVCNRDPVRGGPCDGGPGPDGACGVVHRCTPYRSLRARRGRFALGCLVAVLGGAAMAFSGDWRNELIVPGPLSMHHAHLAQGADANLRCAQCHPAANDSAGQWLGILAVSAKTATSQSSLCLNCHNTTIAATHAAAAHNLAWERLQTSASGQGRRDPTEAVACSACHQEHRGRLHRLTAMTNDACQACHAETYRSFAEGHPEFGAWPYMRRTPIAFDHASHSLKHHPAAKQAFECATCHEADATGDRQTTRGYEATCAGCHEKSLAVSLAGGVPLISLPTLDTKAIAAAGAELGIWPEDADGDFDGALPVWAKLLLASDDEAAAVLRSLGPEFDYFDLDVESDEQLAQGAALARALKALIDDVATRGSEAVAERLSVVLGRPADEAAVATISLGLSTVAPAYRDRWFTSGDSDADPNSAGHGYANDSEWRSDEISLSLRRELKGHADPWLRAWLDVLADAATGPRAAIAEPLLQLAMRPAAAGQCGSCHTVERTSDRALAIQWRAATTASQTTGLKSLTRFGHKAHLVQSQLRDCKSCHAIVPAATEQATTSTATFDPHRFVADFAPLSKAECAACHTATAAGDRCTQCHRYHGHDAANVDVARVPPSIDALRE